MIILEPLGGLANRMRVIASGIWLKRQLDTELLVIWKENYELNCSFNDLFEPIPDIQLVPKSQKFQFLKPTNQPSRLQRLKAKCFNTLLGVGYFIDDNDFSARIWPEKLDILTTAKKHKTIYIQTCQEFGDNINAFQLFKPISKLLLAISKVTVYFNSHVIGVHIRRTDNHQSIKHSPVNLFISAMQTAVEFKPDTIFFISSDDSETKKQLKDIFGDKVFTLDVSVNRQSVEGMQNAVVDLYCLAATKQLFGSYWSSFSEIAARINNIPLQMVKANE